MPQIKLFRKYNMTWTHSVVLLHMTCFFYFYFFLLQNLYKNTNTGK